jgi:pyridoxal phosphate enzyme (YggS family)
VQRQQRPDAGLDVTGGDPERERSVTDRLATVRERIERACERAGRSPSEVTLIGVSKRQSAARVAAAVRAGVTQIGENYVAELRDKRAEVESLLADTSLASSIVWRMIGGLQRNKAKAVVSLAQAVDSVDRESLAVELDRRAAAEGVVLPVLLQVNVSEEAQKSGVTPDALPELFGRCTDLPNLRVDGLMTVPARTSTAEESRAAFAQLRALRDTLRAGDTGATVRELSMGMSADFEVAIEEGSTLVRVGTDLFGPRPDAADDRPA